MPYENHPLFSDPLPGNKLWRYIDFKKFESILSRNAPFFCRADKFSDPFEGAFPLKEVEYRQQWYENSNKKSGIQSNNEKKQKHCTFLANFHENRRKIILINCWHYNTTESDAMWRLYLKDNEGIAIQTIPEKIKACFDTNYRVNIGIVHYIDYQNGIFYDKQKFPHIGYNASTPFIHKRIYFKHEQEYRAILEIDTHDEINIFWENEEFSKGKMISIKVEKLIEKIIVSPNADNKFINKVKETVNKYGFDFKVSKSIMNEKPLF